MDHASQSNSVIVIGAGVVGLACAWHLAGTGKSVTVIDRDPAGDKASFGNAGGIATTEVIPASVPGLIWRVPRWLVDPLGPLSIRPGYALNLLPWMWRFLRSGSPERVRECAAALAALNDRSRHDLQQMLNASGLGGELRGLGALFIYESQAGLEYQAADWALRRTFGIPFEYLTADEARELEPALGERATAAVYAPGWSQVSDPKRVVHGLRAALASRGVGFVARQVAEVRPNGQVCCKGAEFRAAQVVVAAGAWSGSLARALGDPVLLESERGYNTTFANPSIAVTRELVFAERQFVATPLTCGLRIGGAAEFGGLETRPNNARAARLAELASLYLPGLDVSNGTPWCGHRPATPDSLPVIGRSPRHPRIIYAFGHGHLGLTQAATTGKLVAEIVSGALPSIDLAPYSIARFG